MLELELLLLVKVDLLLLLLLLALLQLLPLLLLVELLLALPELELSELFLGGRRAGLRGVALRTAGRQRPSVGAPLG